MSVEESYIKKHFKETEKLLRQVPSKEIALWILNRGYFPEKYVLPPSFSVSDFKLNDSPYKKNLKELARRQLIKISYPKTILTSRVFGIQDPRNYHDIVFYLEKEWQSIVDHLFHENIQIYSYSFPIPITKNKSKTLSNLRSGRMIYEWLEMAENDLILDSGNYQFIVRTDITNFYSSIYTHSIAWALHGRDEALKDKKCEYIGSKIDKLFQYSNDGRTNGIPTGSILSDLIAEIVLASIDRKISATLNQNKNKIDFLAVRFKDDYRFLCQSEYDAQQILKVVSNELSGYNLSINENKTFVQKLPDGLYRKHNRQYFPHRLKRTKKIFFSVFEHTLLIALDIHRANPGTSILEKFISELFVKRKINGNVEKKLKLVFSTSKEKRYKQVKKVIVLLFLVKRESEKLLCNILSVSEQLYIDHNQEYPDLKEYLKRTIESEIKIASDSGSVFSIVWLVFFSRYIKLGIKSFNPIVCNKEIQNNQFYKSIVNSQQFFFKDSSINLFRKPKDCRDMTLANYLDIFDRTREESN